MPSPVLGIDLGTTNSVVAYADEQRVRVLRDEDGQLITPSTVSFDPSGRMLVGHEARERRLVDAENTIFSVKRLIGRPFKSPEVRRAAARLPFVLEEGATGGVVVRVRGETYTLPEVSSFILRKVRAVAEAALGKGCTNAVITVPANFNELQRMATRDAGRIAGLNVLRILNEPTAAALAYGYRAKYGQRIAVYDLGGGTFDISILELSGDVIEVVATAGDTNLGGDDLDGVVADRMVAEFKRDHSVDLSLDAQQYERVRMAAEWIKCQLSHQDHAEAIVKEVAWGGSRTPLDLRFKLSRSELHQLVKPLITRTFTSCEEALRLANVRPTQLDGVILVGGQTRTAAVRTMVAEFFGRQPQSSVDPELVVAQGAALQGYALSGVPAAEGTKKASTLMGNPPVPPALVIDSSADPFEDEPTRIGEHEPPVKRSELPFDDLPTTIGFRVDPDEELTKVGEYVTAEEVEAALATAREVIDPPVRTSTLSGVGPRSAGSAAPAKQPPAPPPARPFPTAAKGGGFSLRTAPAAPPISVPARPPAAAFARPSSPAASPAATAPAATLRASAAPASAEASPVAAGASSLQPGAASSRVTTQSQPSAATLRAATPAPDEASPARDEKPTVAMRPAGATVASSDASPANDAPARRTSPGSEPAAPARRTSPGSERAAAREPQAADQDDDEPLDPIRTHSMARLLAAQGHDERALSIYEELIAKGSRDPELHEEAAVLRSDLAPTRGSELPPPSKPAKPAAGRGWAPSDAPLPGLSTSEESVQIDPSLFLSESQLLRSQFPGPPSMAPLLLDVTPHTLSVETAGGFCESIIERNAPIPTEQTRVFSTSQDDQETVSVRVCQGESRRTDENQVLGQFELIGLRRARRGEVSIAVTFMIDVDGSLNVKAIDRTTGQGQAIRVDLVGAIGDRELETMRARQRTGSMRAPAR